MKRRLSAIALALGLSVSVFATGVYAAETETEAVTEQTTASAEDIVAEAEKAEEEAEQEVADAPAESAVTEEEYYASILTSYLTTVSSWTDDEIAVLMESDDATSAAIASNWKTVKEELGGFTEVTDAMINAEGNAITGHAKYDGVDDKTEVTVTYSINADGASATMNWEIDYPMSTLLKQAGLNTVMGLAIVFIVLAFLAWLISKMHIIPETVEKMSKKNAPAVPEAPKAAPAPAPVVEEEEYVDDLELVAVITAAIAASENTSSDGFVVRSIKKANKRNWQRA